VSKKKLAKEAPRKRYDYVANEPIAELRKLGEQVRALYKKMEENEVSALELGKLLLDVQDHVKGRPGGLKRWIEQCIGDDISTRNRCKYAISLADPDSTRNQKKGKQNSSSGGVWRAIKEIRKAVSILEKAVEAGDIEVGTGMRDLILSKIENLMKRMEETRFKKLRRLRLDKTVQAGKKLTASEQAEIATLPETQETGFGADRTDLPHVSPSLHASAARMGK
jgi:hypothetical protein